MSPSDWLIMMIGNITIALLLAVPAWLLSRSRRYAMLSHWLWVAVLLKLIVPPFWYVAYVPAKRQPAVTDSAPAYVTDEDFTVASEANAVPASVDHERFSVSRSDFSWSQVVAVGWVLGSSLVLVRGVWQVIGFARVLSCHSRSASETIQAVARQQAIELGLRRTPRIRVTSLRLTPLVWLSGRGTTIVLPAQLIQDLPLEQWRWVVAHELAHVRRGDHWIRWIEWAALIVMWWNPLAWWARRQLRQVEETCCDELVLRTFHPQRSQYAGSLLRTLEFLMKLEARPPAVASAIGSGGKLERRIRMIISQVPVRRPSWLSRLAVVLGVAILLPLGISQAQDFEQVAKRLRKAVKKGEITEAQADAMMAALRETVERRREREGDEAREHREERSAESRVRDYLERVKAELDEAVERGRISEEDAKRRYEDAARAVKERFARARRAEAEERESAEQRESDFRKAVARVREKLAALKAELAEAVEAGKLSEEEAERKLKAAAQEAEEWLAKLRRGGAERERAEQREREEREGLIERVRENLARLKTELAEAVESGKLNREEAARRLKEAAAAAEERIRRLRGGGEEREREAEEREYRERESAVGRIREHLARLKAELAEAVEAGKLSEEEAERKWKAAAQAAEERLRRLRGRGEEREREEGARQREGREREAAEREREARERSAEARAREERARAEAERRRALEEEFATAVKRIQKELAAAVEAGKLSEEEAEKKLKAAIDELKQRLERRGR